MKKNSIHCVIRCHPGTHTTHIRLGRWAPVLLRGGQWIVAAGLFLFSLLALAFAGGQARKLYAQSQNSLLKEQLAVAGEEIRELEAELDRISGNTRLANLRFGLERPAPSVIARGIGGPIHPDTLLMRTIPGHRISHELLHKTGMVRRGIDESIQQLGELETVAQQKLLSWRHYPSIKPTNGYLTSGFGQRVHPVTGELKVHEGLDIANVPWTPIVATADGIVTEVSFRPSFYGNFVRIDHGNGYQTLYAHLSQATVKQGQFIQRHQLIGHMGSTGRVTGTHLHYEVRRDGVPVNPARFILPSTVMVD